MLDDLPKSLAICMRINTSSAYEDSQRLSALLIARLCRPELLNDKKTGGRFPDELAALVRITRMRLDALCHGIDPATATFEDASRLGRTLMVHSALASPYSVVPTRQLRCAASLFSKASRLAHTIRDRLPEAESDLDEHGNHFNVEDASRAALTLALQHAAWSEPDDPWLLSLINEGIFTQLAVLLYSRHTRSKASMATPHTSGLGAQLGLWGLNSDPDSALTHTFFVFATVMEQIVKNEPAKIAARAQISRLSKTVLARYIYSDKRKTALREKATVLWTTCAELLAIAPPTAKYSCWCDACDQTPIPTPPNGFYKCGGCKMATYAHKECQKRRVEPNAAD